MYIPLYCIARGKQIVALTYKPMKLLFPSDNTLEVDLNIVMSQNGSKLKGLTFCWVIMSKEGKTGDRAPTTLLRISTLASSVKKVNNPHFQ